jgi:hypothetical protein
MRHRVVCLLIGVAASLLLLGAACSDDDSQERGAGASQSSGQKFPDVIDVAISGESGSYDFDVTVSSPYDSPERYADGWRVVAPDGTVLGERPLAHDHANEQPFTRSLTGVEIPADITEVTVEARDLVNDYGGATLTEALPDR